MDHRGRHDLVDHRSGVHDGGGVDSLGVSGLALVADLHHSAAIAAISSVGHVLDPAVRERHAVLALDVAGLVPGPALAEVCVVIVVMDPVGEVEGVGLIAFLMVSTVTSVSSVTNEASDTIRPGEAGGEASEDGETSD